MERLMGLLELCHRHQMYSDAHDLVVAAYNKSIITDDVMWDLLTYVRNWA